MSEVKRSDRGTLMFSDLPNDVLIEIILNCKRRTIFTKICKVSKRLYELCTCDFVFRKLLEREIKTKEEIERVGKEHNNDCRKAYISRIVEKTREKLLRVLNIQSPNIGKGRLMNSMKSIIEKGDGNALYLIKNEFPVSTKMSHCVRCHKDYHPDYNTSQSCVIHHDYESGETTDEPGYHGVHMYSSSYEYELKCCGATASSSDEYRDGDCFDDLDWDPECCFEGYHTTDRKRARYRRYSQIISCKENGCEVQEEEVGKRRKRKKKKKKKKTKKTKNVEVIIIDD